MKNTRTKNENRQFPIPAVRLIIRNAAGEVLLLRRANTRDAEGSWCLPGGKINYGKTVEEAVYQELLDETSLKCTSYRFLFYQDSLPLVPGKMHCLNLYFECDVTGQLQLNDESSAWAWIGPADIDSYALVFRNDQALRQYWR